MPFLGSVIISDNDCTKANRTFAFLAFLMPVLGVLRLQLTTDWEYTVYVVRDWVYICTVWDSGQVGLWKKVKIKLFGVQGNAAILK